MTPSPRSSDLTFSEKGCLDSDASLNTEVKLWSAAAHLKGVSIPSSILEQRNSQSRCIIHMGESISRT